MLDSLRNLMVSIAGFVFLIRALCRDKDYHGAKGTGKFLLSLLGVYTRCFLFFTVHRWFAFYFFFERSLVPTLVLVMGWGYQPERISASYYMIIYTVSCSIPLFVFLCSYVREAKTDRIAVSCRGNVTLSGAAWCLIMGGFLVKLPIFLVHG